MVKTRCKGNASVRKCEEILTSLGYITSIVERTGRFIKNKDMFSNGEDDERGLGFEFGGFDLIAMKNGCKIKYIQVKTTNPATHKPYIQFRGKFDDVSVEIEQWTYKNMSNTKKKRNGFVIHRYVGDKYEIEDLREDKKK